MPPKTRLLASQFGTVMVVEPDLVCELVAELAREPCDDVPADPDALAATLAAAEAAGCALAETGATDTAEGDLSPESCALTAGTPRVVVSRFNRARSACISAAL
jgi:hypothetical protein